KQHDLWRRDFVEPTFTWKRTDELTERDFLVFPRYPYRDVEYIDVADCVPFKLVEKDGYVYKQNKVNHVEYWVPRRVKLDSGFMTLVGLYLAEGDSSGGWRLNFSFGKHESKLAEYCARLLEDKLNLSPKIEETDTGLLVGAGNVVWATAFKNLFGSNSYDKHVPSYFMQLPPSRLYPMLWGLTVGDGGVYKYNINIVSTASMKLAHQVRFMLFNLGLLNSLNVYSTPWEWTYKGKTSRGVGMCYRVDVSGDSARIYAEKTGLAYYGGKRTSGNFGYVTDTYVLIPIKKIEKVPYVGYVYDVVNVGSSNSFLTHTGIVHNCMSKHLGTAKILMREALQRAEKGEPSESVLAKVRGAYEELMGAEDDSQAINDEGIRRLNSLTRDLRKWFFDSGLLTTVNKAMIAEGFKRVSELNEQVYRELELRKERLREFIGKAKKKLEQLEESLSAK
ncbi:MAG: hypothetical protein QXT64_08750, partial [Desulfurococcaceae archaeon]